MNLAVVMARVRGILQEDPANARIINQFGYDRSSLASDTCISAACERDKLYSLFELQLSFWSSRLRQLLRQ
jgi:hypothetical protein